MVRTIPRVLALQDELTEEWVRVRERRAGERGNAALIARLALAWERSFDMTVLVRVSRELYDPVEGSCMCGRWGCVPLWAALAFDEGLDPDLYAVDAGWTASYCYVCRRGIGALDPLASGGECSICAGDGLAPSWVSNTICAPAMAMGQAREAGTWFPVPCAGCGGWGRRWPGAAGASGEQVRDTAALSSVVLVRDGETWRASYEGQEARFEDRAGLIYLAALIERPGEAIDAMTLVAMRSPAVEGDEVEARAAGLSVGRGGDAGPAIDDRARRQYKARLDELDEEIHEAREANDLGRAERLESERTPLVREIKAALGTRGPRVARSDLERARKAVAKAIVFAIAAVGERLPELGVHLTRSVRKGSMLSYVPSLPAT